MISCQKASDGFEEIHIKGDRSHLDAKALQSLIGQVIGRGKAEGVIGQQNVRVIIDNDGVDGGSHNAIEEK